MSNLPAWTPPRQAPNARSSSNQKRLEDLYFAYFRETGEHGTSVAQRAYDVAEAEINSGVLPAYFWLNLSRSRSLRLRRRARRVRIVAGIWGAVAGFFIARGLITDSWSAYIFGAATVLGLLAYLLLSGRRR